MATATTGPSAPQPAAAAGVQRWRSTGRRTAWSILSPGGLRGTAVEVAWLSTHIATYPLGLARERIRTSHEQHTISDLPLSHRGLYHHDVVAAGTPIILVHGVVDNRSVFTKIKRALRRRGFGRILTVNYSLLTGDIREVARRLDDVVEELVHETGYERVHIVGHSMGGLIARYYVQRLGGDHRVHTVVTLGTPHAGTLPALAVPHPLAKQMRPDSDLVADLAAPSPGCRTRFLAVWSDLDMMIMPKASARMEHPDLQVRTMFVPGVGHMSLAIDGRVVHEVCTTLALLDEHGEPIPRG